jgi:hypothetical protein
MLNLPLLGLPYVQPAPNGVLLLRSERKPRGTLRIFRFGSLLWQGEISLNSVIHSALHFHLVFPERPSKLEFMIFVEADFGPRVSYVAFPVNCIFPTKKVQNIFVLSSKDIFYSSSWSNIISQVALSTAIQLDLFKRKLKHSLPNTIDGSLT